MIYRRESAFTNVTKQTLDTNLVYKEDCTPVKRVTKQQNMSRTRITEYRSKSMLLPYHAMLESKQTHARLGTPISLSRIERSSSITTIFELARGFTHPVHIDKCFEAQFKFGVHLGCKKTWRTGTSDYQSALERNNQLIRSFYYWGRGDGAGGGEGGSVGWGN